VGRSWAGANSLDPYSGGRSILDPEMDHLVRTYVQVPEYPVLSVDPMFGPEAVDQSQQESTTQSSTSNRHFGQSFTTGNTGDLTAVSFHIDRVYDPSTGTWVTDSDAVLQILENGIDGITPIGPRAVSQEITLAGGAQTVALDAPLPVTAGKVYTFRVLTIGTTVNPITTYDAYSGGRALIYDGYDLVFETYVAPLSGQIPDWATFVDNGDGTGTLSGLPGRDGIGSSEVSIRATHRGDTAVQRFWMTALDGNEPPVANYVAGIWWEGRERNFDGSDSYDPDGEIVSYEWDFGDGTVVSGASVDHTYQDDGVFFLELTVTDDMGATDTLSHVYHVFNLPPETTVVVDEPVYEATRFYIYATDSWDEGPVDNASRFIYQYDCADGRGFGGRTYYTDWRCTLDDSGPVLVTVRIFDKDDGYRDYHKYFHVLNLPPWGYFAVERTVAEGQSFPLSILNARDASQADIEAGLGYAFDCGDGLSEFSTSSSVVCPGRDAGVVWVTGVVRDKDGGERAYNASVTVLAPAEVVAETSDDLAALAESPALEPEAAEAIESAVVELTGNTGGKGGASNGATTLLEKDNNTSAVTKIGKAVANLLDAQAADPSSDLTAEINALVSMVKAVAQTEIEEAQEAASSPGDQKRIDSALQLVAEGDTLLAAADYLGAFDAYLAAVQAASSVH